MGSVRVGADGLLSGSWRERSGTGRLWRLEQPHAFSITHALVAPSSQAPVPSAVTSAPTPSSSSSSSSSARVDSPAGQG